MIGKLKVSLYIKTFHWLGTVQEPWYTWVNALANLILRMKKPERVIHPGTLYSDKTFYIIDDLSPSVGLAGWYDRVCICCGRRRRDGRRLSCHNRPHRRMMVIGLLSLQGLMRTSPFQRR